MQRVGYHHKQCQTNLQELHTLAKKHNYTSPDLLGYIYQAECFGELLLRSEKTEMVGLNCCLLMNQKIMVGAFNWLLHLGKRDGDIEVEDTPLIKDKTTFVLGGVIYTTGKVLSKLVQVDVKVVVSFIERCREISKECYADDDEMREFLDLQNDIISEIFKAISEHFRTTQEPENPYKRMRMEEENNQSTINHE